MQKAALPPTKLAEAAGIVLMTSEKQVQPENAHVLTGLLPHIRWQQCLAFDSCPSPVHATPRHLSTTGMQHMLCQLVQARRCSAASDMHAAWLIAGFLLLRGGGGLWGADRDHKESIRQGACLCCKPAPSGNRTPLYSMLTCMTNTLSSLPRITAAHASPAGVTAFRCWLGLWPLVFGCGCLCDWCHRCASAPLCLCS